MCGENGSIRDLYHVVWEVPLSILSQMVHVKLRARNVWTIEPLPSIAPLAEKAVAAVAQSRAKTQW